MPKLEYFLICESISTDQETGRVSLFNVLEDLQVAPLETPMQPHLPVVMFVAVSCWNREPGDEDRDFQVTLRIHPPAQDQESKDFSMNFKMERPRHRLSLRFQGMPRVEPGELRFELLLNGEHVAWHTVNVFPPANNASGVPPSTAE